MTTRRCASCGKPFEPRPQVPRQTYCSSAQCQRERRIRWQRNKLQGDPACRGNQRDAQLAWQERNPDYWCGYRESHPEYAARNRARQRAKTPNRAGGNVAKMDVSMLPPGLYWISPIESLPGERRNAWIAVITPADLG